MTPRYTYIRDPAAIYERSFALIREEADLDRFPEDMHPLALRLAHAAGDTSILADLAWSKNAVAQGLRALVAGGPILADSVMVASGITTARLPTENKILCTLNDPRTAGIARELGTTRSAAAVELWRDDLAGALVARTLTALSSPSATRRPHCSGCSR